MGLHAEPPEFAPKIQLKLSLGISTRTCIIFAPEKEKKW